MKLASSLLTLMLLATVASADPFSFSSTDTPLPIPPSGSSGTTDSLLVVGTAGIITDLNVTVDITHTFTGDLDLFLTHLNTGTTVHLFDSFGGGGNDIRITTFDDEAAAPVNSVGAPFNGTFQPVPGSLSAFDGESTAGTWRLRIVDNLGGDTGTLSSWRIHGDSRPIPEPASLALLAVGAAAVLARRRRLVK